jgi:hypothetical protein
VVEFYIKLKLTYNNIPSIYVWEIDNFVIKSDIWGGFFNFKTILKIIVLPLQLLSTLHIQKT